MPDKTDWARVDAMTDEDIELAVATDPDAAPIADDEWFAAAELRFPGQAKHVAALRVDPYVLEYFRSQGRGHTQRMSAVLKAYADAQLAKARKPAATVRRQRARS